MPSIIIPSHTDILEAYRQIAIEAGHMLEAELPALREQVLRGQGFQLKASPGRVDVQTHLDNDSERNVFAEIAALDPTGSRVGEEGQRVILSASRGHVADCFDGSEIGSGRLELKLQDQKIVEQVQQFSTAPTKEDLTKYAVFLTYVEDNMPMASYAYFPARDFGAAALKGKGAWIEQPNGERIKLEASQAESLQDARTAVCFLKHIYNQEHHESYEGFMSAIQNHTRNNLFGFTSAIFESIATCIPDNTPDLASDARDLFVTPQIFAWDHPWLHMQEAGARSVRVNIGNRGFEFEDFSYEPFGLFDKKKDFRQHYGLISGGPRVVDALVDELQRM